MKIIAITQSGSQYELIPDRTGDAPKEFFVKKEGSPASEPAVMMINVIKHIENLVGQQIVLTNNARSSKVIQIIITE
jgi:hypothetical protein